MLQRATKCSHCGKEMVSKNIRKKFCSDRCRTNARRERRYIEGKPQQELKKVAVKKVEELQIVTQKVIVNTLKLYEEIAKINTERIPPERDTLLGRKVWNLDQKKRILELQKQINYAKETKETA